MPDKKAGKPIPKPVNLKDQVVPYLSGDLGMVDPQAHPAAVIRHLVEDDTVYFTANPGATRPS